MDADEVKDRLKSVINHMIKDEPDSASQELHDILAAKMRNRISPPEETTEVDGDDDSDTSVDTETDPA